MTRNGTGDTEALRAEIQRTRVELGETMEALAAKADVKKRLKSSADQARERVRDQAAMTVARVRAQTGLRREMSADGARGGPAPFVALAAGAVVAAVILAIIQGRRR
ncbi:MULTISPECIES: DUF3618 domain-containing protein [Micromonospora]|uniref:DUF3618 domain-containing protein n=2 Tax=Micromonospora TaxID=1873 RepID=A0A9X0LG52_9ACTN|nr:MULTISPECIES: DUF3618 domain-containing protein [Micromonospora]AEB43999.1 hypothetical protein VAB18032_14435 [Micromonospora maris AB-18-032]KUJ49234.1 hypothetical protein ADL17_09845 [Micromonospora maris]MBL6279415.1 DUF3618 domain-containing protein [Micromonospora fiedleri]RUL91326.1 DUF3618 domain-containing protein [Verrucosispora sp. FIM060022]